MSTITFVSKKPAGSIGNFNYEYSCVCAGGTKKPNIVVTAANDHEAKMLAQMECNDSCEEANVAKPALSKFMVTGPLSINAFESVAQKTIIVTPYQVYESVQSESPRSLACVSFFPTGGNDTFGIRNNCATCRVAVVMWAGVGVYRYPVPGYGEIIVKLVSYEGRLIGEEPCA